MSSSAVIQILLYLAALLLGAKPLGWYMAEIYEGRTPGPARWLRPLESGILRLCGVRAAPQTGWKRYATNMLVFHAVGFVLLYGMLRGQAWLPFNPARLRAVSSDLSFNTAVSFVTNTNWQSYGGESTMSHLSQMVGLTAQNFLSAAAGMAMLVALIRGFARRQTADIGNFWVDLTRSTLYILLPLCCALALLLVAQGTVQTLQAGESVPWLQPTAVQGAEAAPRQTLALGPVASQVAIKQLGTNGGGYFNVNSSHPFENPTPFANFLECLAILLIPAALCCTFGRMVQDARQGWALLVAMTIVLVAALAIGLWAESASRPELATLGVVADGGNMEGKEARFGVGNSVLWSVATTAASNGSVNSMHDSYTPLGGLAPMVLMQLGEVIFGGVGSGLYGMLIFAIVTVFIAGLMVGRTPEYLGKKIEAFEMKMASIAVLVPCLCVLVGSAVAVMLPGIRASLTNPLPHGFSQVLYAFSSAGNNNGSAFAGFGANTPPLNLLLGLAMLLARFWVAIPALAIAGSLAAKKQVPVSVGTLPTHTPLFVLLLIGVVLIVGALTFVPALALGPIAEQVELAGRG